MLQLSYRGIVRITTSPLSVDSHILLTILTLLLVQPAPNGDPHTSVAYPVAIPPAEVPWPPAGTQEVYQHALSVHIHY